MISTTGGGYSGRTLIHVIDDGAAGGEVHEVLAASRRHLFSGLSGGAAPPIEECDLVFVSFETLRDELRKTSRNQGGVDSPIGSGGVRPVDCRP